MFKFNLIKKFSNFKLPDLKFKYHELEPIISEKLLALHHGKHHLTYVNNYNVAINNLKEAQNVKDSEKIISSSKSIIFNGGGHFNHSFYWDNLSPVNKKGGKFLDSNHLLSKLIKRDFDSYEKLVDIMKNKGLGVQGSGWVWLALNPTNNKLQVLDTYNQDTLSSLGLIPLLNVDVWEHAYYLDYFNVRADYLKEFWKIVNWEEVENKLKLVYKE